MQTRIVQRWATHRELDDVVRSWLHAQSIPWSRLASLAALIVPLASCAVERQGIVRQASTDLVGLSANDLRLCAGIPERTASGTGGAEFWSFERSAATGGASIDFQGGDLNLSGLEECRATFELMDGRVTRLAFTRTKRPGSVSRAACAPLVQTCEDMVARGALRAR